MKTGLSQSRKLSLLVYHAVADSKSDLEAVKNLGQLIASLMETRSVTDDAIRVWCNQTFEESEHLDIDLLEPRIAFSGSKSWIFEAYLNFEELRSLSNRFVLDTLITSSEHELISGFLLHARSILASEHGDHLNHAAFPILGDAA